MEYRNFIQDYPARCARLWRQWGQDHDASSGDDLAVTAMVCIASSALVIPMERLKKDNTYGSHADRTAFSQAAAQVDAVTGRTVSTLPAPWAGIVADMKWSQGTRPRNRHVVATGRVPDDYRLREVLRVIRNGLAHGNIDTGGESPISALSFGTSVRPKRRQGSDPLPYEIVTVSVEGFRHLLDAWFELIDGLTLPGEMLRDAAD